MKFSIYLNRRVFVMKASNWLTGLSTQVVFLPTVSRWFLCCSSSLFVRLWFNMWCLVWTLLVPHRSFFWRSDSWLWHFHITKTCLYSFDPFKPHFYIVKLGFTGVFIIFLISAQNIDCGYSLEPPRRGGSNEYSQSMFWAESWKISEFFIWKFSFFGGKIFNIFE